jgi:PHAT/SAM domain (Sterile alpha motif)
MRKSSSYVVKSSVFFNLFTVRSLSQWLRHLEDHISLSYVPQTAKTKSVAFQSDLTTASTSPYLTSTSSLSSTSWQTVAPPPTLASVGTQQPSIVKSTTAATSTSKDSLWDLHSIQMTQDFCDEIKDKEFLTQSGGGGGSSGGTGGSYLNKSTSQSSQSTGPATAPQTALQAATATTSGSATSPSSSSVQLFDTSEDHHISFSKNGTEVIDFDCDDYNNSKSNTQIAFDSTQLSDFLTVPNYLMLENNMMTKTRRSNSLTTTPVTATTTTSLGGGQQQHQQQQSHQLLGGDCYSSSSAENLANLTAAQQKPRSFSLSMASPRSSLTSSGSETRLDEFWWVIEEYTKHELENYLLSVSSNSNINTIKQNHMKNGGLNGANIGLTSGSSNNIGMSGIGQWLKSLRLHKYIWLFSNLTYDQMLDINEEYLQSLGVTKGARHKLVICIQKLRERCQCLQQMEKELLTKQKPLNSVLEEMTNIVLTPMRPFDRYKKDDVAGQFMQMIDCGKADQSNDNEATCSDRFCFFRFN